MEKYNLTHKFAKYFIFKFLRLENRGKKVDIKFYLKLAKDTINRTFEILNNLINPFIMKNFEELQALVAAAQVDATAFFGKGNKAAGTRLRKAMLDLKKLAQDIRVEVQNSKNEG